jgi:hypothetical protein
VGSDGPPGRFDLNAKDYGMKDLSFDLDESA